MLLVKLMVVVFRDDGGLMKQEEQEKYTQKVPNQLGTRSMRAISHVYPFVSNNLSFSGMGGHAAEELVFGKDKVTSGASNDFQKSTRLATSMVTEFGMSDLFGKVSFDSREQGQMSPQMCDIVNEEVKQILDSSYKRAVRLLKEKNVQFCALAEAVLEKNTLSNEEILTIVGLKK